MRRTVWPLLAALILVSACSDSGTEPKVTPPPAVLASATIGSGGGTLETEDFVLDVPAGAFGGDIDLELYDYADEFPADGGASTGVYKLSGLPAGFDQPLTVKLKVTDAVKDDGVPLLLVGETVFVKTLQTSGPAWNPLEAAVVDGYLTATLPAIPTEPGKEYELIDLPLGGTLYYSSVESVDGHFKVYHPLGMGTHAGNLAGFLEGAYAVVQGMGFSYEARTRWPVRAIVLAMPSGRSGECVPSVWGDNYGSLRFSTSLLPDAAVMRVTAGHEFFHLVQAFYDPRGSYAKATEASRHLWVDEAAAVWSEELFTGGLGTSSSSRNGLLMEPFEGFQAGIGENAGWHGYGMSALIKYMVNKHSDTVIKSLYDRISANEHPIEAVRAIEGGYSTWLNDFFQQYFSGVLYGSGETAYMIADNVGEFRVTSDADTLKTFTKHDPALSACLFKVVLDYEQLNDMTYAEISLDGDGPAMINAFKFKSSDGATLLGSDSEMVTVSDLKDLQENGYWVIVMVTAMHEDAPNYFATQEHTTKIHLKPGVAILEALQRSARLSFWASIPGGQHDFRYTSPDTTYVMENENNFPNMGGTSIPGDIFSGPYPALGLSGRSFSTSMTYNIWSWDLSGTFSADGRVLQSLEAYGEADAGGGDVTVFSFRLNNLPVSYEVINEDSCHLTWSEMGTGAMSDITYVRTFPVMLEEGEMGTATITYIGSDWYAARGMFTFNQAAP